jgi:hypothetical protein
VTLVTVSPSRWDIKREVWGEEGEESVPMLLAEGNGGQGWGSDVSDSEEEILVSSRPREDDHDVATAGNSSDFVNITIES